jgi:DNA-binding beta-propeller fold protein YncE
VIALAALAFPAAAPGAKLGALEQLPGAAGCLVDRSEAKRKCTSVRALRGPAPFLGSEAVAISPDAKHVYVASSRSNAIAIFRRNAKTGKLSQRTGTAGCIAAGGRSGCAPAVGLEGPNSVAVSADGKNVYATAVASDAVAIFSRDPSTGALSQASDGSGCIANAATTGCTTGRALDGADVVSVSADGKNVYVGALCANALVILDRDPSTGALTQATDGSGCIADSASYGCTTGVWLEGANAVAVSVDDGDVYVTSLLSNSLTSFTRTPASGDLAQKTGTSACAIYVLAVGCSLGRALEAPEGLTASPDGANVYAAAFESNAIAVFNRDPDSGALIQMSGRAGCVTTSDAPDCRRARALKEVSSLAVSPDGKYLYAAAFASDAVTVFKRSKGG